MKWSYGRSIASFTRLLKNAHLSRPPHRLGGVARVASYPSRRLPACSPSHGRAKSCSLSVATAPPHPSPCQARDRLVAAYMTVGNAYMRSLRGISGAPVNGISLNDARRKYEAEIIGNILAHQHSYHPFGLCRGRTPGRVLLSAGDGEDRSSGDCPIFRADGAHSVIHEVLSNPLILLVLKREPAAGQMERIGSSILTKTFLQEFAVSLN